MRRQDFPLHQGDPDWRNVHDLPWRHCRSGLKQKILALYPDDQATGFKLGDMRGVFTLKKTIEAGER